MGRADVGVAEAGGLRSTDGVDMGDPRDRRMSSAIDWRRARARNSRVSADPRPGRSECCKISSLKMSTKSCTCVSESMKSLSIDCAGVGASASAERLASYGLGLVDGTYKDCRARGAQETKSSKWFPSSPCHSCPVASSSMLSPCPRQTFLRSCTALWSTLRCESHASQGLPPFQKIHSNESKRFLGARGHDTGVACQPGSAKLVQGHGEKLYFRREIVVR